MKASVITTLTYRHEDYPTYKYKYIIVNRRYRNPANDQQRVYYNPTPATIERLNNLQRNDAYIQNWYIRPDFNFIRLRIGNPKWHHDLYNDLWPSK